MQSRILPKEFHSLDPFHPDPQTPNRSNKFALRKTAQHDLNLTKLSSLAVLFHRGAAYRVCSDGSIPFGKAGLSFHVSVSGVTFVNSVSYTHLRAHETR